MILTAIYVEKKGFINVTVHANAVLSSSFGYSLKEHIAVATQEYGQICVPV